MPNPAPAPLPRPELSDALRDLVTVLARQAAREDLAAALRLQVDSRSAPADR